MKYLWHKYPSNVNDISRSKLVRYFSGIDIPAMSMISHEISWWDISVVQVIQVIQLIQVIQVIQVIHVIQVMQLNKVMQVRLAHLWPDFRVICTKKYTLFPITVNVILLFVRRLKTEIVIDNVRKKTLKYMYDTCPCWKQTMLYLYKHQSKDAYCK